MVSRLFVRSVIFIVLIAGGLATDTDNRNYQYRQFDNEIDDLQEEFYNEHYKFMQTGIHSKRLMELYDKIKTSPELMRYNLEDIPQPKVDLACFGCRIAAPTLFTYRRVLHMSDKQVARAAIDVCVNARITTKHVCEGAIRLNLDSFLFVVDNQPKLTANILCSFAFQGSCGDITEPEFLYSIKVDQNYPPWNASQVTRETFHEKSETFKIVHITDVHYDPRYVVGNNAKCDDPNCCRESNGLPENAVDAAGRWGSYNCDVPWESVEDVIDHIKSEHSDAEIVYYTGDTVDHGAWETSVEHNLNSMTRFEEYVAKELPNVKFFPILGNHESHPFNIFAPEEITGERLSTSYLYNHIAKAWRRFLPQSTELTLTRGGYYTVLVRPGYRIIALNNNVCYNTNWWSMYHPQEHTIQLNWLHDVLMSAEKAGEKVHILLHQPTGVESSYYVWAREYQKIIDRFYHIIKGQFNGHTHREEFYVYYKSNDISKPINVAWNGGSTVTYINVNPSYRVYTVDKETLEIIDADTYYYNLTDANLPDSKPVWQKMYSFRDEYDVENLLPSTLDKLVTRFAKDKDLLTKYSEYKFKLADPILERGCDKKCLLNHLCDIVSNQVFDNRKCDELTKVFNEK